MLETFAIKNFKLLKDQLFHLSNLTVFSGLNSMGKSSVIQSLLLLRQSYEKNMLPGKGLSLMGDYVQIGNGADVLSISANHVELYYLSKDMESNDHVAQVSNPRIDSAGKIDHWPAGFFDEWDNSLDALLDED